MTVVLTGDVHQRIPSADRSHAVESESALAVEYAQIAERHGLKVTLFLTGLALKEDMADALPLRSMENVEIGGHGWDAFHPRWAYRPLAHVFGSPHGHRVWQRRNIARTCAVISRFTGKPVTSWRNHAYLHDSHTPALLAEAGLQVWSDEIDLSRAQAHRHESGILVLPVNTTPDHENLYHGDRTPETVLGPGMFPNEWCARVVEDVERVLAQGGTATLLAHPLCMKVADDWKTFEELCTALSSRRTLFASEVGEHLRASA